MREEWDNPVALRDNLLAIGREGRSGLLLSGGEQPFTLKIRDGRLVNANGEEPTERLARALAAAQVLPDKSVDRVVAMARTGRQGLLRVLMDLALVDEDDIPKFERIRLETAFRIAVGGTGPWQWRPMETQGTGGEFVLNLLAHALATQVEPRELVEWAGHLERRVFRAPPGDEAWRRIEGGAREVIASLDGTRSLREVLTASTLPGRQALVWLAIASRLDWLTEPGAASAVVPAQAAGRETAELEALDELEVIEEGEDLEAVEEAGSSQPEPDGPPLPPADAVPFWHKRPSADLFARLDLPAGAAGQGVAQAYSRRFRELQKAAEEHPDDRRVETWRKALLEAYRILHHPEARALYESMADEEAPSKVIGEMSKRALSEGIRQIRAGHLWEGTRAVQEALSWNDQMAEAWVALGFVQASRDDDPEELAAAAESFDKAVALAPEYGTLRFYRAVLRRALGRPEFAEDAAWLQQNADRAPAAWARFLADEGGA